ncbi:MAG TPA: SurA N-terminal domain-containing protein [Exilispira sp.]|nr:SurA N-terminal domain-containing protein [Exilispira sp.]
MSNKDEFKNVVCTVEGLPITIDEVMETYQVFLDDIFNEDPETVLTDEEKKDLLNESLYTLIDEKLIFLDAKKNNILITEEELSYEEEEFRKQFSEDLPLEVILEERNYNIEIFREKLLEELTIKKMIQTKIPQNAFSDDYLWQYYLEHKDQLDDKDKKEEEKTFEKITAELREVLEGMVFLDIYTNYVDELFSKAKIDFNEKNCEILFQKR